VLALHEPFGLNEEKRWDKVFSKIGKQTTTHGDPCSTVLLSGFAQ